jgi:hypothetical protein
MIIFTNCCFLHGTPRQLLGLLYIIQELKVKVRNEFPNEWGDYKIHSNLDRFPMYKVLPYCSNFTV